MGIQKVIKKSQTVLVYIIKSCNMIAFIVSTPKPNDATQYLKKSCTHS